ncbi:MAG TPA: hypothetical protein VIV11_13695 [Kofleriaceae bacterium]
MRPGLVLCAAACLLNCKDKTASQTASSGSSVGASGSDASGSSTVMSGSALDGGHAWDAGSGSAANIGSGTAADTGSESAPNSGSAANLGSADPGSGSADPGSGSAESSGRATTVVAAVDATDKLDYDDKTAAIELRIAFANHVPKLPAASPDGAWIADYGSDAAHPVRPSPVFVRVARLDGKGKSERLEIVDQQMVEANADAGDWEVHAPPQAVVKVLRERAAAVAARLRGFASLSSVETRGSTKRSATIGAFKLASTEKTGRDAGLVLLLTDARGKTVHREQIRGYSDNTHPPALEGGACEYGPRFQGAYLDQTKRRLYVAVAFRWREECTAQEPRFVAWELPEQAKR